MPESRLDRLDQRRLMSALADGDADADTSRQACASWADDADARQAWHAYHLIGDVLRSDDLAGSPVHGAEFLAALRVRLAGEPVPLAPAAPANVQAPQRYWRSAAAVAAGFVAVGGVVLGLRGAPAGGAAPAVVAGAAVASAAAPAAEPPTLVVNGRLIRDAQLDRYLRAHREVTFGQPAALPGGALRSVETVALER